MAEGVAALKIGVMRRVEFGLRDIGVPCLSFDMHASESVVALQALTNWDEITTVLRDGNAVRVQDLEGRACWYRDEGMRLIFDRVFKMD